MLPWPKLTLIALSASAALTVVYLLRKDAADSVRQAIERQNHAAGDQSDIARSEFDRCADRGWVWSFRTGKCLGPPKGGRN